MPRVNLTADLSVTDIVNAVSMLNDVELYEFEKQFEQIWLSRISNVDKDAANIASAHRLDDVQKDRLQSLLEVNREGTLTPKEEEELNLLMGQSEQKLMDASKDLLKLASARAN